MLILTAAAQKGSTPYLVGMGSVLVFCSVAGVAEGLRAAGELAHVGLLSRVGAQVGLQILQPAVRLPAALELKERRRLVRLYGLGQVQVEVWRKSNPASKIW